MKRLHCAIYTRKSSDEGLEKEFNSLDAQREACAAYVLSQKHAGWLPLPDLYDDGGLSGGTMERPALLRLLANIKSGKVQIVVVYKVDRLTRSLADFAKIVDVLDAHGASFVSVTQQFNTTTSMGRLTLNMLLSFAQFEREIASERIRDKIAASKAKGMWMGGNVPLGYDARDRKLVINAAEAKTVRMIFRRYAEIGSVTLLQEELDRQGVRSKQRDGAGGRLAEGGPFSRGILYLILQNHLYHGAVEHKGNVYPGQHEAIIEADLWSVVQDKLAANRKARELAVGAKAPSLLTGLIFDGLGNRMTPTHANKSGRRYRYYISASLLDCGKPGAGTMRVPASEVESLVLDQIRILLASPNAIGSALAPLALDARELQGALDRAAEFSRNWIGIPPEEMKELLRSFVTRVTLLADRIDITVGAGRLAHALGASTASGHDAASTMDLSVAAELRRSGQGKRMIIGDPHQAVSDTSLIDVLKEALAAREKLLADSDETLNAITEHTTKSKGRLTALMRLSYLAPDIVADILVGRQPPELSVKRLLRTSQDLPLDWPGQRAFLGLA